MRVLVYDIETAPSMAYIWSCWQNNVPINMVSETGELLCWCAKWLHEDEILSDSVWESGIFGCISSLHSLIDQADAVVAHNGNNFDAKVMNTMFLKYGLEPPAPAKMVDTLAVAKSKFKLLSNKLDFVGRYLEEGEKLDTGGFELWLKVTNGDKEAQQNMLDYNAQDVRLLERVYLRFLPWITNHPNTGLIDDATTSVPVCTNCGSSSIIKKGVAYTKTQQYQRYKCNNCGTPLRGRYTQLKKNDNILTQET